MCDALLVLVKLPRRVPMDAEASLDGFAVALHERGKVVAMIDGELFPKCDDSPTRKCIDQREQFLAELLGRRELLGNGGLPLLC